MTQKNHSRVTRRELLRTTGAAGVIFNAGCFANRSKNAGTVGDNDTQTRTRTDHTSTQAPTSSEDTVEGTPTETATAASGTDAAFVYTEVAELRAVRQKAEAGRDPWSTAHDDLLTRVKRASNKPPRSVTDDGAEGSTVDDPTKFASGGKTDRHDYLAARHFGARTRDLALAYQFTGNDRYAKKAIEFIEHWTTDPGTGMFPSPLNYIDLSNQDGYPSSVELNITLPNFYYAASLVRNYSTWAGVDPRFENWARTMLDKLEHWANEDYPNPVVGNNTNMRGSYVQHRGAVAAYLEDDDALNRAAEWFKEYAIYDVNDDGSLPLELQRSEALEYSLNALQAYVSMAEIAYHADVDVDLYGWQGPSEYDGDKPVLEAIADYTAPYVVDPAAWPHNGGGGSPSKYAENGGVYEVLHSRYRKRTYLDAVTAMGRPIRSGDYLGPLTATHANLSR